MVYMLVYSLLTVSVGQANEIILDFFFNIYILRIYLPSLFFPFLFPCDFSLVTFEKEPLMEL